jgi:hypothetical protein
MARLTLWGMLEGKGNHIAESVKPGCRGRRGCVFPQDSFCDHDLDPTNELAWLPVGLLQDLSVKFGKSKVLSVPVCFISVARRSRMDMNNLSRLRSS